MIKKQTNWQIEKFTFSGSLGERMEYDQLRREIQAMQTNGWEVQSTEMLGYDPTNSNAVILVTLVKYEWVEESVEVKLNAKAAVDELKKAAKEEK